METNDIFDAKGKVDHAKVLIARDLLEAGDHILVSKTFSEHFGWNGDLSLTCWKEVAIDRATKTTITADGTTFMRNRAREKGKESGRAFCVTGEVQPNTAEEIVHAEAEIRQRRALRGHAAKLGKELDAAAVSFERIKGLSDIVAIRKHIDSIMAIIGEGKK